MPKNPVFVNRRKENDRRTESDPCKDLPVDLLHRKRRKSTDRRDPSKSLVEDYYAYTERDSDSSRRHDYQNKNQGNDDKDSAS